MQKYKNFLLIILAFIAGSFISLATTLALAHGGDTNLIHSCYKTNTGGSFRIVGTNDNCDNNETALDWSRESQQPIWGNIVGTLSNQTDLQNALDAKQDKLIALNDKHSKTLTNNSATSIFSFPLAAGELSQLHFKGNILAKKDADWCVFFYEESVVMYNDNGTLRVIEQVTFQITKSKSVGSIINFDAAFNAMQFSTFFTLDLTAGVVTVTANPGDIGATPDSMIMNYTLENPSGNSVTFL